MTLREALANQGNDPGDVDIIIQEMVENVLNGSDPEDELEAQGLEPDYVMELLEECL